MTRFLTCTAVAVLLGLAPALAAETPPVQQGASPDASQSATMPDSGSADKSSGAAEQSSAPPDSAAASDADGANLPAGDSADQSSGAKEQSSAPPKSSAAENKPNPTLGTQNETEKQ